MTMYRKKPVVIEARQWDGTNTDEILEWVGDSARTYGPVNDHEYVVVLIDTLEGAMTVSHLDFVIKGVQGEFYPCKPDIFEATYEEVL